MNRGMTSPVLLVGLLLTSFSVLAARDVHEFEVSVNIPSSAFHVLPADPDWIHQEQELRWNTVNSSLGSLRKYFDTKNEGGAIEAQLDSHAYLSNGNENDNIDLHVMFNGALLSASQAVNVVSATDAALGRRVLLEIVPKPSGGVYKPGRYFGSVNMMFNAVVPDA